jgi:hypothetical protein
MPTSHQVRESRIREAIAWLRLMGYFVSGQISPIAVTRLTDRFVSEYFYTKKTAAELTEATLRRLRYEREREVFSHA